MNRLVFTVTNNLGYDQRMIRICTSLSQAGYAVTLVGTRFRNSGMLPEQVFKQKRLFIPFRKGFAFYAWYNIRLFFSLLLTRADLLCCIDLDTMLPVYFAAKLRGKKMVYDAHEYFSQQKEVITRPRIYAIWHWIEKRYLPRFRHGYTVGQSIADVFEQLYGVKYAVIRNVTLLTPLIKTDKKERIILYQGAVNEARGFEQLIPAMKQIDAVLVVYGDGNFFEQAKALVTAHGLASKVLLKGAVLPAGLSVHTAGAYLGINLVEYKGLNQYYSLANKFFDYMHAGIPQVTMNFPEYKRLNDVHQVAILIDSITEEAIIEAVNRLLDDENTYRKLSANCLTGRAILNWQEEEKKLLAFYQQLFAQH